MTERWAGKPLQCACGVRKDYNKPNNSLDGVLVCDCLGFSRQAKLEEIRSGKGDLETRVEALRTAKEAVEQPERDAKERHLKAWEGKM